MNTAALTKKLTSYDLVGKDLLAEQGKLLTAQERVRLQHEAELKREQALQGKAEQRHKPRSQGKAGIDVIISGRRKMPWMAFCSDSSS